MLATTAQPPPPLLLSFPVPAAHTSHKEGVSSSQTALPVSQVRGRDLSHPLTTTPTPLIMATFCFDLPTLRPGSGGDAILGN
jgi:hypothetical protein